METATVTWSDGTTTDGTATVDRYNYDIGWVFTAHPTIKPLQVSSTIPQPNERVEFVTYGGPRQSLRHFYGTLARSESQRVWYSANVINGDSGGTILNSQKQVVGVQSVGDRPIKQFTYNGQTWPVYQNGGSAPITPIRSFLDRVRNRVRSNFAKRQRCVDGDCQPASPSDPIYPPAQELQREYVTREDLEELKRLIESISLEPGPRGAAGRDGSQGPAGPRGPAGKDGRDGEDAVIDYDLLAREVVERLPPIYPMWIDRDGQVLEEIPGGIRLGDTLPLRIEIL